MTPKQPFWVKGTIRLPPNVEAQSNEPCPTCGKPCVHVQPRVMEPPTYAFRCEEYHEWGFIGGVITKRFWGSNE